MQLIATRRYSHLDGDTLESREVRDTLVRVGENAFFLHTTSAEDFEKECLVRLDSRAALLWINETSDKFGLNWD
jgi:hypothetical protein